MGALVRQNSNVAKNLAPASLDVLTRAIQIENGQNLLQSSAETPNLIKHQINVTDFKINT